MVEDVPQRAMLQRMTGSSHQTSASNTAPAGLTEADIPQIIEKVLKGLPQSHVSGNQLAVEDNELSTDYSIGGHLLVLVSSVYYNSSPIG